jgi:predicted secreted protein
MLRWVVPLLRLPAKPKSRFFVVYIDALKQGGTKMKSKPTLLFAIAAISTLLFACSPASALVSVEASCDHFNQQEHISKDVEVPVGDSFTVALCSNPSTGFQWSEMAEVSDQTVLRQTDHKFVAPEGEEGEPPAPGTPGQEIWTFEALEKGTCNVSMEYSRPWEGGETGVWTFNLTVVVV